LAPKDAVVDYQGQRGVWRANAENKAQFISVKVGLEDAEHAELISGVTDGDPIIVAGAGSLRADDNLAIIGQDGPSNGRSGSRGPRQTQEGSRPRQQQ
jgi:hypothetical protein